MTTLHTRQLKITNLLADYRLRKTLRFISSELRRELMKVQRDILELRQFAGRVRRCTSNYHPCATIPR